MTVRSMRRAGCQVLCDPKSGEVLRLAPGTRLELRFRRRGLGVSAWRIEDRPQHLLPLQEDDHGFWFLVFGEEDPHRRSLRLVRRRPGRSEPAEVRDLTVLVSAS